MSHPPGDDGSKPARRARPAPTPAQQALGLLVRREHSRKELALKLQARGISREQARATVEQMHEAGWQSNARFAESLARNRAQQGYGPLRIRAELSAHGMASEEIHEALASLAADWNGEARERVRRRFGPALAGDLKTRRKAADFLLRRGFAMEHVRNAIGSSDFDDDF